MKYAQITLFFLFSSMNNALGNFLLHVCIVYTRVCVCFFLNIFKILQFFSLNTVHDIVVNLLIVLNICTVMIQAHIIIMKRLLTVKPTNTLFFYIEWRLKKKQKKIRRTKRNTA